MIENPKRKPNRLPNFDYSSAGAYHIILCSDNKQPIFSEINKENYEIKLTKYGKMIDESINYLSKFRGQNVEKYVIMPNHIHILLLLDDIKIERNKRNNRVSTFVTSLKRFTNRKSGINLWQRSYYDHIIRNEEKYLEIWRYIEENPIKWSLDEYYIDPKM